MSLEAAQSLMELGVKPREVSELMIDTSAQYEWMNQWIQGFASFANNDYSACIQTLKHLEDTQPLLRNNVHLLVTLGRAQHYSGNFPAAALTLQRYTHSLSIRNALIRNDPSNSLIIRNNNPLNFSK